MSLRALGRQFHAQSRVLQAKFKLRNQWYPNAPGTTEHPTQGKLFFPTHEKFKWSPDFVEAGRRKTAGENNPAAPWDKGRMLTAHFPGYDPRTGRKRVNPVQGELF